MIPIVSGLAACASGWQASPEYRADPRRVAEALGDPAPAETAELVGLPTLEPPAHLRTCCVLGMDLHVDLAGVEVPLFEVGNVIATQSLGAHAYTLPVGAPEVEGNGLVYTCRGGFVDVAHVRECADIQLFLAVSIARSLEVGTRIVVPWHGAETTIVVDPIPESVLAREGPIGIASTLASWATFRIEIWHEVATWFGYQSVAGFSEQVSAFSPEDLYSNALGVRLGAAIFDARDLATDDEYGLAVTAYLEDALRRLGARSLDESRAIMQSLDGRWWDSSRRLPDVMLVPRRAFPRESGVVVPHRAEEAFEDGAIPPALASACAGARPRALRVAERIGDVRASELVHLSWRPEGWADASFPFPDPSTHVVEESDLDALVDRTREDMRAVLGAHFDELR